MVTLKICGEVRLVSNDTQLFITNNNIIWGNLFKNFVQIGDYWKALKADLPFY